MEFWFQASILSSNFLGKHVPRPLNVHASNAQMIWSPHVCYQWLYVLYALWPSYSPECCVVLTKTAHGTPQQFSTLSQDNMNTRMHKCHQLYPGVNKYHCVHILYSAKFVRVFKIPFAKLFQWNFSTLELQFSCAKVSMDNIMGLCCQIRKGHSPKRYLQSRYCFAELERTTVWRRMLDKAGLYAMPIVCYVWASTWSEFAKKYFNEIIIHENLDPQKFCAIQNTCG